MLVAGKGFTGWENFLQGIVTSFTIGYGQPFAENRFGETNLYAQDDFRLKRNLTLNLGVRWEGVTAPKEIAGRFPYGYKGDFNNVEPRIGFAWTPETHNSLLERMTGGRRATSSSAAATASITAASSNQSFRRVA